MPFQMVVLTTADFLHVTADLIQTLPDFSDTSRSCIVLSYFSHIATDLVETVRHVIKLLLRSHPQLHVLLMARFSAFHGSPMLCCVRFLQPGGWLRVKSDFHDNVERIEGLLDSDGDGVPMPRLPLTITGRCDDVTRHPAPWDDDIETNYQSKFRKKGEPVYAIELVRDATEPA